ncbi:ATP-binding protein [uncultured Cohaesibacter sp.]|uniref:YobI family P-loop NTPase n=1 Tax=uncultured Cohaesibacter sp. TaxID=1002546 RepID=UPI0029C84C31|nr:ATP-binding protein [uncultured Cohaesibacter sp.]
MSKRIAVLTNWLAVRLIGLANVLKRMDSSAAKPSKFVNLAPTDQADKDGVYFEALDFAVTDPKVYNIALTGPYGSGKSSIIQSFLKKHPRPSLHISLAAFAHEAAPANGDERRKRIERSILEQMLYGADANKLPLSRFKRIQSPGASSTFKSLCIAIGLLALWFVFAKREVILDGSFFKPFALSNWLNLGVFALATLFFWAVLHHFYVASFGLSLKSFSLKDIEIRPSSDNQDSILNRHLDEIIYFFQSTEYDLVIIEDLDRFEDPEIFVTLREINSLVNENAGIERTIRFLYALRDDVFANTDRTKFFEFIIPVIPIINTSNSIDMVLEQGKRLALDGRLSRQFLREVSRYLNDLRLIQNIFNEYAIYAANLETDNENVLNADKLLAILIYKNVYPRDFEHLHRGEGNLAKILSRKDELIMQSEAKYKSEIADLEQKIEAAGRQTPADQKELRQIYGMALIQMLPANVISVSLDARSWIPLQQLVGHSTFEQLIDAKHLYYRNINGAHQVSIASLQDDVDPLRSYSQRESEIENKATDKKKESLHRIRELRSRIGTLRTTKFNELIRSSAKRVTDLFDGFHEKGDLARFLILEGHLDDTYYQYTSLFHSGRLSPNDNKFLIQIRSFEIPEPTFPIDNPKEVIVAMRDEDFGQSYVLNIKLVDCLLRETIRYSDQTQRFFDFIASNFDDCEAFFEAYYATGQEVSGLLYGMVSRWKQFVPRAIASKQSLSHVTQLLMNLPESALATTASNSDELPEFVASKLPEILAISSDLAPERLESIGIEVRDLPAIGMYTGTVRFMVEKGLFELSIANFEHAYREVLGETNLTAFHQRNYTTIRSITDPTLMTRVERDFDLYLSDVLLELDNNSEEDVAAILDVLCRKEIDEGNLRTFLGRQTALLPTLDGVPERFHAMVFELRRIEPTWGNCITFLGSSGYEAEILLAYLNRADVRALLLKHPMPSDTEALPLRQTIVYANALSDENYREYIRGLPNPFEKFPEELASSKLTILIEEHKITFLKENLDLLDVETDLPVLFVAENIESYLDNPDDFALDDDFRASLLRMAISDSAKRAIVDLMDMNALTEFPDRAALIGPILDRTDIQLPQLDSMSARSLILNTEPVETQISLFNKLHSTMTVEEVRQVLASLPKPFSEITIGYHTPRLSNSGENRGLVKWLDTRGIISSWSEGGGWFSGDDIRVNLKRR